MTRPNVLLITVDSLRADHVSCLGNSPVETPRIDAVGEMGTTFTDTIAQGPFTTFSMPSLFTARYPTALEYIAFSDGVVGVYADNIPTLTERLHDAGYATAGFHSNPLLSNLFNFDWGFETFDADLPFSELALPGRLKLLTNKFRRLARQHAYLPAETITDRGLAWVDDNEEGPFFLWTHYMDVHGPYQSKAGWTYSKKMRSERLWHKAIRSPESITPTEHDELSRTYAEEVVYTDAHLGRLVTGVRAATDRPVLVIITADHGDGFAEHGYYGHPHEVHDELVHVPLVIDDPTRVVDKGIVEAPTELIDVAPTVLEATGAAVPEGFEGTSLRVARDRTVEPAIAEGELMPEYRAAFITARWKYVVDEVESRELLFDRRACDDRQDVSGKHPEELARFRELTARHRNRTIASCTSSRRANIDDEAIRERLRRLGYL